MNEQNKYDWMVCVSCMTFNHAPYIVDAMNGFTMQETNFPFVCTVVDDDSTDGEQEVIKSYLNEHFDLEDKKIVRQEETDDYVLTFARHKINLNCHFVVLNLKYNHYRKKPKLPYVVRWRDKAKYIALCEGDDFWIDPKKLQKQVEYMEQHPECSLCHGDVVYYDSDKKMSRGRVGKLMGALKSRPYIDKEEIFKRIVTSKYGAITLTMLYRSDLYKQIPANDRTFMMGDATLLLDMSQLGSLYFFSEVFGVYRIHSGSEVHQNAARNRRFGLNIQEMYVYYSNKYGYKIPFLVKFRYNTAYMRILIKDGKVTPPAYYVLFDTIFYHKRLLNNNFYFSLYKKFVFPFVEKLVATIVIIRNRYRLFSNRKLENVNWEPK